MCHAKKNNLGAFNCKSNIILKVHGSAVAQRVETIGMIPQVSGFMVRGFLDSG